METFKREATLIRSTLNMEARTVEATLSTETAVKRWFGNEVLRHTQSAIDMTRAQAGLPLLHTHDQTAPIGRAESIRLNNRKLKAKLRFGRSDRASEALRDVEDGVLSHVSIGYSVEDWIEGKAGRTAKRWTPLEVSLVAVPADHAASIERQHEGRTLDDNVHELDSARQQGVQAERERTSQITALFKVHRGHDDLMVRVLGDGTSVEDTQRQLLEAIATGTPNPAAGTVEAGRSDGEKFVDAMRDAIYARAGILQGEELQRAQQTPLMGYTLSEIAREYVRVARGDYHGRAYDVVGRAFTRSGIIGHDSSDFQNILRDAANKMAGIGYEEAEETWQAWCGTRNLPDFKLAHMPVQSLFGDLDEIPSSGEYEYGTFSDVEERIQLATFGKLFSITRQAVINDDQNIFEFPRLMGRAANRKVGDKAYAVLTANAAMNQDSVTLFHASHGNLVGPGSGAVPSVATLNAGFAAMGTQTDPAGKTLNITPRFLLSPKALEGTVRSLLAAEYDPATASGVAPNPWQGRLDGVYEARLDADDPAQWYLAAAASAVGTVVVGFLNGIRTPYLEQQQTITVDGTVYKIRIDAAAAAADFRGLYQNDGN